MATAPTTTYDTPRPYDVGLVKYDFPPSTGWPYDRVIPYGSGPYDTSEPYDTVLAPFGYYDTGVGYDSNAPYDANTVYGGSSAVAVVTPPVPTTYDGLLASYQPDGWWKLGDGVGSSVAIDSSGNGNAGAANQVTYGGTGPVKENTGAASITGNTTSDITVTGYNPTATALTLIGWIKPTAYAGNNPAFIANSLTYSDNKGFLFVVLFASGFVQAFLGNGTTYSSATANISITTGAWFMCAMTWDGTTIKLYVNGLPAGSAAFAGPLAAGTAASMLLGGTPGGNNSVYFDGSMAEMAVIKSALSASQIAGLYNSRTV